MSFYIREITVSGKGKTTSVLKLKKGLNIICGLSNTGKTYVYKCIDYIFGSDREPFDESTGYKIIEIDVVTDCGTLRMKRELGDNEIIVFSQDDRIASGEYKTRASQTNYDKTINYIWLKLIGIDKMHLINSNKKFKKSVLSWRMFCHMFMLNEMRIISEKSALLPEIVTNNTTAISSLIFLLTGKDFSEIEAKESKQIKEVKKKAIKQYINNELYLLSKRNEELTNELGNISILDLNNEIDRIVMNISENEKMLNFALNENKKILNDVYKKNESLSECNMLLNRYSKLSSQYNADLKRINFIVDGEINFDHSYLSNCPFCDGKINMEKKTSYINAAMADHKKIKLQLKDLTKATDELSAEKELLEKEINELTLKRNEIEQLIRSEIKPELENLKSKLNVYKNAIEIKKELDMLKDIASRKTFDLETNEKENEEDEEFIVKDYLDFAFIDEYSNEIKLFLEKCKFKNIITATFDKDDMDITVNGKKKSNNGKGFNAFYNSVVEIVLAIYMNKNAKYPPNFLMLDSPILSLKEGNVEKPEETIRYALFENLLNISKDIQTIIIENDIPAIDYGDANIIEFSKKIDFGRYGFLQDVRGD